MSYRETMSSQIKALMCLVTCLAFDRNNPIITLDSVSCLTELKSKDNCARKTILSLLTEMRLPYF
jgi:hypothetical protein